MSLFSADQLCHDLSQSLQVCFSVLQCVAVCCTCLPYLFHCNCTRATPQLVRLCCCSMLQCVVVRCSVLHCNTVRCSVLHGIAMRCSVEHTNFIATEHAPLAILLQLCHLIPTRSAVCETYQYLCSHARTHTHAHTHSHTHMQLYHLLPTASCTSAVCKRHMDIYIYIYTHTHAQTHTRTHVLTHTHTHTYSCTTWCPAHDARQPCMIDRSVHVFARAHKKPTITLTLTLTHMEPPTYSPPPQSISIHHSCI